MFTLSDLDRVALKATWDSDQDDSWFRLTVDQMKINGEELVDVQFVGDRREDSFFLRTRIQFDPWRRPGDTALTRLPRSVVFPSLEDVNNLFIQPCRECMTPIPEGGNQIIFEYSLDQMPPPLPADFNYDGRVDFRDFLILSSFFGINARDFQAGEPFHYLGDANFDFRTDFDDFLILRDSFGTSREPQAAAVPEPSGFAAFAIALLAFARLRRRRG